LSQMGRCPADWVGLTTNNISIPRNPEDVKSVTKVASSTRMMRVLRFNFSKICTHKNTKIGQKKTSLKKHSHGGAT